MALHAETKPAGRMKPLRFFDVFGGIAGSESRCITSGLGFSIARFPLTPCLRPPAERWADCGRGRQASLSLGGEGELFAGARRYRTLRLHNAPPAMFPLPKGEGLRVRGKEIGDSNQVRDGKKTSGDARDKSAAQYFRRRCSPSSQPSPSGRGRAVRRRSKLSGAAVAKSAACDVPSLPQGETSPKTGFAPCHP